MKWLGRLVTPEPNYDPDKGSSSSSSKVKRLSPQKAAKNPHAIWRAATAEPPPAKPAQPQ